ncbi:hypothetical protein CEXT_197821 [Caerostris extrusa]|uniref:Uncharacterized protein n=1 Tax=Caerostris extrusa TaxID=172846 RepID=A0AAV4PTB4_CAEEX|nr:hypothetical protein CEXT_197821 [Caerostris extrusa]
MEDIIVHHKAMHDKANVITTNTLQIIFIRIIKRNHHLYPPNRKKTKSVFKQTSSTSFSNQITTKLSTDMVWLPLHYVHTVMIQNCELANYHLISVQAIC